MNKMKNGKGTEQLETEESNGNGKSSRGFFSRLFGFGAKKPAAMPGRNDPCWCGSGQKYKKCHADADAHDRQASTKKPGAPKPMGSGGGF